MGQRSDAEELWKSTSTDQHNGQKGNIIPEGADTAKTPPARNTPAHAFTSPPGPKLGAETYGRTFFYLLTRKFESRTIKEEVASARVRSTLMLSPPLSCGIE